MWGTTTTAPTGGAESTPAEEYRTTLKRLREKEADLLLQLEGHPAAPHRLRYELALVREMVRDTQAALRRLRPQRPRVRRYSLEGQSWQWLEKQSWDRLESMDRDNRERLEWMRAVVDDGTSEMTARQRQVFDLVYRVGKEVKTVAEELGVDPSTISRTARRAVEKLRRYAEGRELVRTCTRPDGSLEIRRVVEETALITPRQRQVLLLTLDGLTRKQAAQTLGVDPSTVGRTLRRGERRLKKLTHYLNSAELRAIRNQKLRADALNWRTSCKELSAKYGVSLWVVYKLTAGTRRWEGMTALQYDIWTRRQAGETPKAIAQALGMDVRNVYQALNRARQRGERKDLYVSDGKSVDHL